MPAQAALPADPKMRMWSSAIALTAERTCVRSEGGSCLPGLASRYSRCASTNAIFSAVEMLTFAQPRAIRSVNCASVRPGAAVQDHRDRVLLDDLGHALGHQLGLGLVEAVGGADGRRERVDAGRGDERGGDVRRVDVAALVGADPVLDAGHRLDLALDLRAVAVGLGDDLDRLARVLLDVELRAVEQDGVPARVEAARDPLAVGAVVEVQRDRDGDRVGPRAPDRVERVRAERLHRLERRLDDQRRLELGRRGEHRVEREVVDDVDRRDAVALGERPVQDPAHRHDGHGSATLTATTVQIKD